MTERHSLVEMRKCAARELALRKGVYPKWVKTGRYTARQAHLEIDLMQSIVDHFDEFITRQRHDGDEP